MDRAYTATSLAMSLIVMLTGIAMFVLTLTRGGGVASLGFILGLAFAVLGAARLYLARASIVDSRT